MHENSYVECEINTEMWSHCTSEPPKHGESEHGGYLQCFIIYTVRCKKKSPDIIFRKLVLLCWRPPNSRKIQSFPSQLPCLADIYSSYCISPIRYVSLNRCVPPLKKKKNFAHWRCWKQPSRLLFWSWYEWQFVNSHLFHNKIVFIVVSHENWYHLPYFAE